MRFKMDSDTSESIFFVGALQEWRMVCYNECK